LDTCRLICYITDLHSSSIVLVSILIFYMPSNPLFSFSVILAPVSRQSLRITSTVSMQHWTMTEHHFEIPCNLIIFTKGLIDQTGGGHWILILSKKIGVAINLGSDTF
jgi:hypothetical protein